ncbi:diguanylate cyclase [Gallaecimonas kandeliae]|uniref:sensor domain-containing diguanylate cyclase n=1 Tax=Gallaecimonas kandeliae TaxID=3029055 RepID=UPI0026474471|nr:sensor domain-containing diguanylate cyclase [Gallaecimonas kandeliae]WKE64570.1 diguanylate cyclase [Gallaecimonas kandeliae]
MEQDDLHEALQKLQQENARLKRLADDAKEKLDAAMDGTGLCIWQLHVPSGKLVIFNRRWGAMLGFQPKELEAHFDTWRAHLHPEDRETVLDAFYSHIQGKSPSYQALHRMLGKNGVRWVLDRGRVVERDEQGQPLRVMGTHIDVTQEKEYELQLAILANQDPLTGVLNRAALIQHFDEHRGLGHLSLCFIDLDDFKQVNDSLGHRSGDELLIQLTDRLRSTCPKEVKLGRLGGDEFLLLLPWPPRDPRTLTLAQACIDALDKPFQLANGQASVGLSMGVEEVAAGEDFASALARADQSMYQVKKAGKRGFQIRV